MVNSSSKNLASQEEEQLELNVTVRRQEGSVKCSKVKCIPKGIKSCMLASHNISIS